MSNHQTSQAARFLMDSMGGNTVYEAMEIGIEAMLAVSPLVKLPVYPSRYAQHRRTHPAALFARMRMDGGLQLDNDQFRIVLRDISLDSTFGQDQDRPECDDIMSNIDEFPRLDVAPRLATVTNECQFGGNIPYSLMRRQRFTYAHELCHTLFFDIAADKPYRPYIEVSGHIDKLEERLCDYGAGLLLMPELLLREKIGTANSLHISILQGLTHAFQVSLEALMARIAQSTYAYTGETIILLSGFCLNRYTGSDPKLRVLVTVVPPVLRKNIFIPHNIGVSRLGMQSLVRFYERYIETGEQKREAESDFLLANGTNYKVQALHEIVPGYQKKILSYLNILSG